MIGSVGVNVKENENDNLAAFVDVNGELNIVEHDKINSEKTVFGPNNIKKYKTPKLIYSESINASISTPIFVGNKLIVAGYNSIRLYKISGNKVVLVDKFNAEFESTPVVHNRRVYIASRNGNFYCLGN